METKLLDKVLEEVWGTWISIPIIVFALGILEIGTCGKIIDQFSRKINESEPNKLDNVGIILIIFSIMLALFLVMIYVIFTIRRNTIKKASRGKIGVLLQFDAENKRIYTDAVRKFGDIFKNSAYKNLEVVFAPFYSPKIDRKDKSIVPFLRKKRCVMLLSVKIQTDELLNTQAYELNINATIIHCEYEENIKKAFQKEFALLLSKYRAIDFDNSDRIQKMRIAANEVCLACEYIIGLSFFLNGNWFVSEDVLKALLEKLPADEKWRKMVESIRRLRYKMFLASAELLITNFQITYDDDKIIDEANRLLEQANECVKNTYDYCLNKAYYYVIKEKDSVKAHEMINICQQKKNVPPIWKYSDAFLKAYDNKSIGSIITGYKKALSVDYNLIELISFVETVLNREPERDGLLLALGILYDASGQKELAVQSFNAYLEKTSEREKARQILHKKGYLVCEK